MLARRRLMVLSLIAAAAAAALALPLCRARQRWNNPSTLSRATTVDFNYGQKALTTNISCSGPEAMLRGRSYTITCSVSTTPSPLNNVATVVEPSPAQKASEPHPTVAEDALFQRDTVQAQDPSHRAQAIASMRELSAKYWDNDAYRVATNEAMLLDPTTQKDALQDLVGEPAAAQAVNQFLAQTQLWLGATEQTNANSPNGDPLRFARGNLFAHLGNTTALDPPQTVSFTLSSASEPLFDAPVSSQILVHFNFGLTRTRDGSWIDPDLGRFGGHGLSIPIRDTWMRTYSSRALLIIFVLLAIAIGVLVLIGLIFGVGRLFPVLALNRWRNSAVGHSCQWCHRHALTILYFAAALAFLAPNPFRHFSSNREAYHQLLDFFLNSSQHGGVYFSSNTTSVIWLVVFFALFLGGMARLLPVQRRVPRFLLNIFIPAVAVGFCLSQLLLFFVGFLFDYFTPQSTPSGDRATNLFLLAAFLLWLGFIALAGAAARRLPPLRWITSAGLAITLVAIPELLLFSALYYAAGSASHPYDWNDAFDQLPLYLWIGVGFLLYSQLLSTPEKPRRRAALSHPADSAQNFALTAIALCAFAVTQIPHAMDNVTRLKTLRSDLAAATIADRLARPGPGSDDSPRTYDRQQSRYGNTDQIPPRPLGQFSPLGFEGQIYVYLENHKFEDTSSVPDSARCIVSVTEQNGHDEPIEWSQSTACFPLDTQPVAALQQDLGSTDKDIHTETGFEHAYREGELKIANETTSIPGTPVQVSTRYVSWCLVLLNMVLLCLIEDRLKLVEHQPEDAAGSYLLWGNTFMTRTLSVLWPLWLAFAMLLQVGGVAALTIFQGVALRWCLIPLLLLAACIAPVSFSIAMSCYRIRRAIRTSLAPPPPDVTAPASPVVSDPAILSP